MPGGEPQEEEISELIERKEEAKNRLIESKRHDEVLTRRIRVKTTDEIDKMLNEVDASIAESPREFLETMIQSGSRVLNNPYGTPVVEIIAPEEMQGNTLDIIQLNQIYELPFKSPTVL